MAPDQIAVGGFIRGDEFLFAALFLGVDEAALHGKGGPAGTDGFAPDFDGRGFGPVGGDGNAGDDAVPIGPAEAGPFGSHCGERRRLGFPGRSGQWRRGGLNPKTETAS